MAETLPEGLISTNDAITGDVGDDDGVEVEDIQKLWKCALSLRLHSGIATDCNDSLFC